MGCGASRGIDANGTAIPARLRPLFLQRLEDIRTRRYINHAPSKKVLLLGDTDHEDGNNDSPKTLLQTKEEGKIISIKETNYGKRQNDEKIINISKETSKMINDDDKYCNERMIAHHDDDAFPGSPSFRVYFQENGEDHHHHINNAGKYDTFLASDQGMSPKESYNVVEKKNEVLKSGRKKRSFKKVMLPKGGGHQVKNLLNVKLCYTPSTITPKTPS